MALTVFLLTTVWKKVKTMTTRIQNLLKICRYEWKAHVTGRWSFKLTLIGRHSGYQLLLSAVIRSYLQVVEWSKMLEFGTSIGEKHPFCQQFGGTWRKVETGVWFSLVDASVLCVYWQVLTVNAFTSYRLTLLLIVEDSVSRPFTADVARRLLESTGCLFVKQRAGYLSYAVDPKVLPVSLHFN